MSDHAQACAFRPPSFGWVLALAIALALPPAASARDAGLAFVLGPGSRLTVGADSVALPQGTRIELIVDGQKQAGGFPVRIRPAGFTMPEIDLGKERPRLRVRLGEPLEGSLVPRPGGFDLAIAGVVEVELADAARAESGSYALALTTGPAATTDLAASGSPVDVSTRSARLVAAGTVGSDSPVAAGAPFLVVLEGAFEGWPSDLR